MCVSSASADSPVWGRVQVPEYRREALGMRGALTVCWACSWLSCEFSKLTGKLLWVFVLPYW